MGLRDLLKTARGESRHVISIVADIRGFSAFSQARDSADVATYVSKVYLALLDQFGSVCHDLFFKPTGDGLLLVVGFDESTLKDTYRGLIDVCLHCHDNFGTLLKDTPMINFPVPNKIGFGITRGSACALVSSPDNQGEVIDFSGHKLNLASRLQDLARPSGVVIDGDADATLLSDKVRKRFTKEKLYVRSVAEVSPIAVLVSESVRVAPMNRRPLSAAWKQLTASYSREQFKKLSERHNLPLDGTIVEDSLTVKLSRPANPNKEVRGLRIWKGLTKGKHFVLVTDGATQKVAIIKKALDESFADFINDARARDKLTFEVNYQALK